MLYVFDTNSLRILSNFFPQRFPSFWTKFDKYVSEGKTISVREVLKELEIQINVEHLQNWIKENKKIFFLPSEDESLFVSKIFAVSHFQHLISHEARLKGNPVADPFVIAVAKIKGGCVVTEEKWKKNSAKIPNICEHFEIKCTNLEGFMETENWEF